MNYPSLSTTLITTGVFLFGFGRVQAVVWLVVRVGELGCTSVRIANSAGDRDCVHGSGGDGTMLMMTVAVLRQLVVLCVFLHKCFTRLNHGAKYLFIM